MCEGELRAKSAPQDVSTAASVDGGRAMGTGIGIYLTSSNELLPMEYKFKLSNDVASALEYLAAES